MDGVGDINFDIIKLNYTYCVNIDNVEENIVITKYSELSTELIQDKSISETMTCPLCLGIVIDPKCCNQCKHVFCNKCLEELVKSQNKQCKCPLCKIDLKISNLDSYAKRLMDSIQIKCFNNGCNIFINYGDYDIHLKKCNKSTSKCKYCNIEYKFTDMVEHLKICPNIMVKCKKCTKDFKISEAISHIDFHDSIKCKFCHNLFSSKIIDGHLKNCDKSKICEGCENRISLLDNHDINICYQTSIRLRDHYKKLVENKDLELKLSKKKIEELELTSKFNFI